MGGGITAKLTVGAVLSCLSLGALGGSSSPRENRHESWIGVALPSRSAEIASVHSGLLAALLVDEGTRVDRGQPLARLDTRIEELELERLRVLAESDVAVRQSAIELRHARRRERRFRELAERNVSSHQELEQYEYESEVARLRLERAEQQHQLDALAHERAKAELAEHELRSPFDGVVSQRLKSAGETVEELTPVLEVIAIDPLWIEFDCPVADESRFALGQRAIVTPIEMSSPARTAMVVYTAPRAHAASQTLRIRLALDNPDLDWRAGLKLRIERPAAGAKKNR